ncbi:hypothetical protein NKJ59_23335 [Mesorhizobium australicum]|uniref:hypothetical protein n=1 Tax=Mesorhizobium australicum TaxID=536018 RepID=UPI00333ADCE5
MIVDTNLCADLHGLFDEPAWALKDDEHAAAVLDQVMKTIAITSHDLASDTDDIDRVVFTDKFDVGGCCLLRQAR